MRCSAGLSCLGSTLRRRAITAIIRPAADASCRAAGTTSILGLSVDSAAFPPYAPAPGFFDELFEHGGSPRPAAARLVESLAALGSERLRAAGERRDAIFVQDTARMLDGLFHADLQGRVDDPFSITLSWESLLVIMGAGQPARGARRDDVLRALTTERDNPSAVAHASFPADSRRMPVRTAHIPRRRHLVVGKDNARRSGAGGGRPPARHSSPSRAITSSRSSSVASSSWTSASLESVAGSVAPVAPYLRALQHGDRLVAFAR